MSEPGGDDPEGSDGLSQGGSAGLSEQVQAELRARAILHQAIGVLMGAQGCSPAQALDLLRELSQDTDRELNAVAAEVIRRYTGHDPEPPRPLTFR